MEIVEVEIGVIRAVEHSQRIEVDEERMLELVGSIRNEGLLQALTLKVDGDGYVVVCGHRRLEALKRLGWEKVPAVLVHGDEASLRTMTFAENFFSEDLTPVELAVAIADEYKSGRMSIERMAAGFRRSGDWVKRQIAMCGWPAEVLEAMHKGHLSIAAGANLAMVEEQTYREFLVRKAVEGGATAQTTAAWLQGWRSTAPGRAMAEVEDGEGEQPIMPAAPVGPCLCCSEVFRVDAMSHVPLCPGCIRVIREAQHTSGGPRARGPGAEASLSASV